MKRLKSRDGKAWAVVGDCIAGCASKQSGPVMYLNGMGGGEVEGRDITCEDSTLET